MILNTAHVTSPRFVLELRSSPPMTPPLSPSSGFVGLLGSVSPTASPIGSPKERLQRAPGADGTQQKLRAEQTDVEVSKNGGIPIATVYNL